MNITRHNYEEYFVLYMDNELGNEERRRVELFVEANPDLKEELNWLLQSRLVADSSVVFSDKEQLTRSDSISINTDNFEEWLLSYTDNELSAEQKIAVEQFLAAHSVIKTELEFLQKTKLRPDEEIVFSNKEILYRKEEKVRVVAIRWWRIAVAAALLLAVSTTTLILFNNKNNHAGIASDKVEEKKSIQDNPAVKQSGTQTALTDPQVGDNKNKKIEKETIEMSIPVAKKEERIEYKEKNNPPLPIQVKQDDAVVAAIKEKKKTNALSRPTYNPNANGVVEQNNPIAMTDPPVKESLTIPKETNSISYVTPNSSQPLDNVIAATSKESVDLVDDEQPGRKNKLRGFFRKITRTFEKTTNIKATDDEDRLLLGGLAIKL
jgi:hypothetical protein